MVKKKVEEEIVFEEVAEEEAAEEEHIELGLEKEVIEEVVEFTGVVEEPSSLDEIAVIGSLQDHESRLEAIEQQIIMQFDMIASREELYVDEPISRERFLSNSDIAKGFEDGTIKWEKVLPRRNEVIMIVMAESHMAIPFYKGKIMEIPSNFAEEMRRRDRARGNE